MLGSPFDAEDAVQETMLRAWRGIDGFEGRAALRSWLYRIATNVCLDAIAARQRRARPMDLGPAREPVVDNLNTLPEATWIEPMPDAMAAESDPADAVLARETLRLAFVAALQYLPARQRAVLVLCEALRWRASEAADLLGTSVASVNSALQRARATLDQAGISDRETSPAASPGQQALLARWVSAFEAYDVEALTEVIREDAIQSMPPFDLWLAGRENILAWFFGPGSECAGSRVLPAPPANGTAAFGQYKPDPRGGHSPWALQVIDIRDGAVSELTFFLATDRLFPLFGLPPFLPEPADESRPSSMS
jgi:RNA polymerase sigma-70 factor (ECF subfamily)